jgi:solute carrier family 35, member C2
MYRFLLVITASALSGIRWSLTQLLLQHTPATRNPFSTLFHLAPVMFISLLLSHILFESPAALLSHPLFTFKSLPLLLSPGILAFCMTSTEFELIRRTSVVTLSVSGMFKEVLTVLAGTVVFGDHLAVSNIWGVLVTLGGISWYNWIKIQKMREDDGVEKDLSGINGYEMVDREGQEEIFSIGEESEQAHSRSQ